MDNKETIYENPRKIIADALVELGQQNSRVVYVSCDSSLGASGGPFNQNFPERHFEFGIQEQNGMGEAAGLAISGKIPFIAAYVPFVAFRCFEQIRDDVCKTRLNVNIMGNNCGFSVGPLGPTHVVLEDIAVIGSLPNITIISPADGPQYREAIFKAAQLEGPVYLRVHREKARRIYGENYQMQIGKGEILKQGSDITVVATSTMVANCLDAAEALKSSGIDAEVINISTLKPIDREIILGSSAKTKKVVTVEEHSTINGLGSIVANVLAESGPAPIKKIGIEDVFAVVGQYQELIEYYGLTGPSIAQKIEEFLNPR
ncbi:MAG: transketolase C-terminal domain-containing protein [Actinomycetota bacterium]|nr:transketolase C-terminal domain-containing protein [Actinomycetota bacterium]